MGCYAPEEQSWSKRSEGRVTSLVYGEPSPERDGARNSSNKSVRWAGSGCVGDVRWWEKSCRPRLGWQGRTRKRRGAFGGFKARQTRDSTGRSGRKYRFLSTASFFFFLSRCFVLVSALRFALLVQILMWQTAMPIDVALMPNQALTSGTCSLFIKAHIHHFAVVSFPPTLKHLLIWLVCMHDDPNRFHRIN